MKIGVIACDRVRQSMVAQHGDYPQMMVDMLSGHAQTFVESLSFQHYSALAHQLPAQINACDGYILTGSRHAVYEAHDWIAPLVAFLQRCDAASVPILGICFGHQLLALALGGRVGLHPGGWGVGVARVDLVGRQAWMAPELVEVGLLVSHRDQVQALPAGSQLLLSSEFCPNFMFLRGASLGLQGHPEFTREYLLALMSARQQCIEPERFAQACDALENHTTHEPVIVNWLLQFFSAHT